MIPFVILATVLVAGALLLVVPPLLGAGARARDHARRQRQAETALVVLREQLAELEAERNAGGIAEAEYQRSREELEQRALDEGRAPEISADLGPARKWAVAVIVALPLLAGGFYLMLGEPRGLDPEQIAQPEEHQITPEQMAALVAQLAERLERQPEDVQGWLMLGRSYAMLNDAEAAGATWRKIGGKVPDHPDVLADWADLLAVAAGGKLDGEPERLVRRALELEPNHFKALALAGTFAFSREEFAAAAEYWERILRNIDPGEEIYGPILASVNEARTKAGMTPLAAAPGGARAAPAQAATVPDATSPAPDAAAKDALTLGGRVSVSPELAARVTPDDAVYVFARPAGGGVPVAALRMRGSELPATFSFADAARMSDAPLPEKLELVARVSKQGDPAPEPGDLEAAPLSVAPDAAGVEIVIDRVRE